MFVSQILKEKILKPPSAMVRIPEVTGTVNTIEFAFIVTFTPETVLPKSSLNSAPPITFIQSSKVAASAPPPLSPLFASCVIVMV